MGRRDAVQVTLEVIARMRQLEPRLRVTYEPGWETRGNGTSANYEGGIVHHTASASSLDRPFPTQNLLRDGRSDLDGPLCNESAPACTVEAPWIHVVAAHPANHAGASGGRSMGPLPVTSLFNPRVRGLEIDYAGTVAMLAGQLYVAHLWSRANADVVGDGDINRIRAHAETSITGKWDPGYAPGRTIDMAAFRRDAAAVRPAPAPIPSLGDPDMRAIRDPNGTVWLATDFEVWPISDQALSGAAQKVWGGLVDVTHEHVVALRTAADQYRARRVNEVLDAPIERNEKAGGGVTTLRAQAHWEDYNARTVIPEAVAKVVGTPQIDAEALASQVITALDGKVGLTGEDVEAALRKVLREGTGTAA